MQLEHETHHIPKNSLNANIIIISNSKTIKLQMILMKLLRVTYTQLNRKDLIASADIISF